MGAWIHEAIGIRQGTKTRAMDDFAASRVSDALASTETMDPDSLDWIIVNVRAHLDAFTTEPGDRPASSPFHGLQRHSDHQRSALKCRMWDLASAYRQLVMPPALQ